MQTKIKRFSRRTLSLILALLMMVSIVMVGTVSTSAASSKKNATGYTSLANKTLYFDNTNTNWGSVAVYVGHSSWTTSYALSNTNKHNIWKVTFGSDVVWDGRTKLFFSPHNYASSGNGTSIDNVHNNWTFQNGRTATITASNDDGGSCFFPASSANNTTLTRHPLRVVAGTIASNDWDNKEDLMTYSSNQHTYTYSNVANGDYTFAVVGFDDWGTSYRWAAKGTLTGSGATWADANDSDKNIKLTLPYTAPSVKVTLTSSNKVNVDVTPPTYTISYDKGSNGTGTVASTTKDYGTDATLSSSTFSRSGYTQTGWSTTDGGAKVYDLGGSYTTNADVTLYPYWTQNTHSVSRSGAAPSNGTIKFSTDNSTWVDGPITVAEGGTYYVKASPSSNYKISSFTVGGSAVAGASGSTSAVTYTGTMSTSDVTASASFALQTFNVKKTESGDTTGGTVQVGSTTIGTSNTSVNYGTNYTVTVTAPTGYNVSAVSGVSGTTTGLGTSSVTITGVTISSATTIAVTYASAGSCAITAKKTNSSGATLTTESMKIGDVLTVYAAGNSFHTSGSFSVTTSDSTIASVSSATVAKNGTFTVTAKKFGTATITISCPADGASTTFDVSVSDATITMTSGNVSVDVGGTNTRTATGSAVGSAATATMSYSTSSTYITVNSSSGLVTGVKPTSTGQTVTATYTVTCDGQTTTKTATYKVTVSEPTVSITSANNADIGGTVLLTASSSGATTTPTYTFTSSNSSAASISGTTLTAGTTGGATSTITVTARYNASYSKTATQTFTVNTPSVSAFSYSGSTLNIGATKTVNSITTTNPSNASSLPTGWTITYSSSDTSKATVDSSGTVTGVTPGEVTITASLNYNNTSKATKTATLTVNTPTITMSDITIAKGDKVTLSATTSNPSGLTMAYELASAVSGVTISGNKLSVTGNCSASSATIVAKAKNSAGTVVATKNNVSVTIQDPSLTIADTADQSTKYLTVGTNYAKALTSNFNATYTVTSSNTAVATVSESSGTLTVVPVAKGTATITVTGTKTAAQISASSANKSKGLSKGKLATGAAGDITATQTFTVNVAAADTYKYFYFTNGVGWSGVTIYMWQNSNTNNKNHAWPGDAMVKIGKNENNQDVYAYRYSATAGYDRLIISDASNSNNRVNIGGTTDLTLGDHNAAWCKTANTNDTTNAANWYTCTIAIPQVTIDDATTALGTNYTMTATKVTEANVGEYRWSSGTTSVATVTADTNATPSTTVVPVDAGTSTITVKAYAVAPTNWTLDYDSADALPFIGSTDTATMTVTADDRTVTYSQKVSYDGTSYDAPEPGVTPGTLTVTKTTGGAAVANGSTVPHNTSVTFHAVANTGFTFVGWEVDGVIDDPLSTADKVITVNADKDVKALFQSDMQVHFSNKLSTNGTTYDAPGYAAAGTISASYGGSSGDSGSGSGSGSGGGGTASSYYIHYNKTGSDNPSNYSNHVNMIEYNGKLYATIDNASTNTNVYFNINTNSSSSTPNSYVLYGNGYSVTQQEGVTALGIQNYGSNDKCYVWANQSNYTKLYVILDNTNKNLTVTTTDPGVSLDDGSGSGSGGSGSGSGSSDPTIVNDGDYVPYGTEVTFSASANTGYVFAGWKVNSGDNEYVTTDKTVTVTSETTVNALFKKIHYITLYNTYEEEAGNNFKFVSPPPRQVKVGTGSDAITYTYAAGTAEQRGEDHIATATGTSGTYYEGNRIPVIAGTEVKLTYSALASSDAISGVFFNNDIRYTHEYEDDNLYKNRVEYTGASEDKWGNEGDDNFGTSINPYTYLSATTLYADASFYSGDTATTISGQTYNATVNNSDHTVTWTAVDDYLNIDLELATKYRIIINNDDWNGIEVTNSTYNAEGYYYPGERINGDDGIEVSLDTSDSTKHFSFTDANTIQRKTGDNTYETVTDVRLSKVDGKYYIQGTDENNKDMPAYDIYVDIGIREEYKMYLDNFVVADDIGERKALTETYSKTNSSAPYGDRIGTITAVTSDDVHIETDCPDSAYSYAQISANPSQNTHWVQNGSNWNPKYKGTNTTGTAVEAGKTVTYTFTFNTYDSTDYANYYSFVGWFEGTISNGVITPDYTKKLSGKTTFTYTPKKDTVVVAAGTRDIYLGGNFTNGGAYTTTAGQQTWSTNRIQMEFDPTYVNGANKGRYYYKFDTVTANTEYQFRCYDTVSGSATSDLSVWSSWSSDKDDAHNNDDILYGRHKYDGGGYSHGQFVYKTNTNNWSLIDNTADNKSSTKNHQANGYAAPVTVYFYAYDGGISVTSEYQWSKAYVSAGRGIDCTNYDSVISSGATPSYNIPTVSVADKTVGNKDVDGTTTPVTYGEESVYKCTVKEKDGQITVSACPGVTDLELDAFVVYDINTKKSEAVKHTSTTGTGNDTKYVANITVPQNSSVYIVPVYKFTDAYISAKSLKAHTVYVRTDDIDKDLWGGLVAMYSWGSKTDSGGWPGQLLIPSDDGTSFYGQLAFGAGDLRGITFNNYCKIYGGAQKTFLGTYGSDVSTKAYSGNSTHVYQTYDYREPISIIENIDDGIYEDDDMDLTFALKSGDMTAAPTIDSAGSGDYNRASTWEYLTDRSGKKRVDLNGNALATNSTETYRIVAYYTNSYASSGSYDFVDGSRSGTGYSGSYSINWTVYDATGASTGVSGVLSAAYVDTFKSDGLTYIASKLIEAGLPVSGKAVKIAYENPGTWSETIRYSGQWYADGVNSLIEAKTRVGIYSDGAWLPSDTNAPGYGTATISCPTMDSTKGENLVAEFSSGNSLARVIKKRGTNGQVQFSVNTDTNFLGWYREDGEGGFEPVGSNYKNTTITPSFNDDITYYAFYSASASYVFEYTSRNGGTKQYTAKGTDLTDAELANGGTLNATARSADITSKLSGINNIKVFNRTLTYELNDPNTSDPYVIKYTAGGSANTYEVNVYNGSESKIGTVTSTFGNKAVDLYKEALTGKPANSNIDLGSGDNVFIGWKKYNTGTKEAVGDYLSTQPNFGYNVTENMDIIACYGSESDKETARADLWKAYIDKNVITQELTNATTGKIYNDSIIAFRNGVGTNSTLPLDGNKECGIVILAQANTATDAQKTAFDTRNQSSLLGYANYFRQNGTTSGKMNSSYGEAYAFCIKAESLSDLNRVDLCQILDFEKFTGGKFKVMSYYYDASVDGTGGYKCSEVISKNYTVG